MGKWVVRFVCGALAAVLAAFCTAGLPGAAGSGSARAAEAPQAASGQASPSAESEGRRVVSVAFPEAEGLSMINDAGVRSGLVYDWLVEIAKYTGWEYEFVDGEANALLEEAASGGIELVGGMYYREQLEDRFDYSTFTMGSNRALLICREEDKTIASFDLHTLDGKTIGAYENNPEKIRRLENFIAFNNLNCEVLRLDLDAFENCLENGTADLIVGGDTQMKDGCRVVAEFEGEPYYFALREGSELMPELDEAMRQIYAADPGFARTLYDDYFPKEYASPIQFSDADRAFVDQHETVRVAVVADQYPLYYQRDGSYQGIAKDMFDLIAQRTGLSFRFVHADTYEGAIEQVLSGDADVMGCFMDGSAVAAERGFALTKPYSSLDEVVFRNKLAAQPTDGSVVAQVEGRANPVEEASEVVRFSTYEECLEAVNTGHADLTSMPAAYAESLFTNRSYSNVTPTTSEHRATEFTLALPEPVDSSLYSVLSKAVNSFSDDEIGDVLTRNTAPVGGRSATVESFVSDNPLLVVALSLVFFVLVGAIAIVVTSAKVRSRMMKLKLEKAEETGQAKADFLSRMSHEIRTPMNAIIGLSNVASLSGEATPAIRSDLEKINTSAQFLLSLVNDILDMSKIENDKMHIELAPLRLRTLAERLNSMFCFQAEEKGISFEVVCTCDDVVVGDDVRLQQVLANLVSNAFKFTEAGGNVTLRIEERGRGASNVLFRFSVTDDGAGIQPEDLERIFVSFEQAAENHRNAQGTGLGLAISSNLVRLMGGRLEVESRPGAGSEFHFTLSLPLGSERDAVDVVVLSGEDAPEPRSLKGTYALLAEDNDLNAEIAAALLDMEGIAVDRAANGREAVEMFAANAERYDFVLMDVKMPVLDGLGAAREIRGLDRVNAQTVPIVALTANTFKEDRDDAKAAGMDGFIPKPFDAQQLYDTLRSFLPSEE